MSDLSRVSKNYTGVAALECCDLSIQAARTTVLIGPSGYGKSTILRLIIGLELPDAAAAARGPRDEQRAVALGLAA